LFLFLISNFQEGFATVISTEFDNAGFQTLQMVVGERMFNTTESQHLPPINVTFGMPWLSAMVKVTPSSDWFVGFSDFRSISYDTETYYKRIVIRSFLWDAGTDGGQTYTALDRDLDPQEPVSRITSENAPRGGHFLSPNGVYIPQPAEFECVWRVGEGSMLGSGIAFNESEIRPPLYVERDDDFWEGLPPCKKGHRGNCFTPADKAASEKEEGNQSGANSIMTTMGTSVLGVMLVALMAM
jgi:hypothetical protein